MYFSRFRIKLLIFLQISSKLVHTPSRRFYPQQNMILMLIILLPIISSNIFKKTKSFKKYCFLTKYQEREYKTQIRLEVFFVANKKMTIKFCRGWIQ